MNTLEILDLIASDSKRKFKEQVLSDHFYNDLLRKVFWAAYDSNLVFWISKHPTVESYAGTLSLDTAIDEICANLWKRKVTGHSAVKFYQNVLSSLTESDATVLRRIIDGDLRCGVSVPTINKIWNGLIPIYPIMTASDDPSRLQFPDVVVQTKYDGVRCIVTRTNDGIIKRTRNGKQITSLSIMDDEFNRLIGLGEEWDGELVCYGSNDMPLPRKVSNGIITKALRGTISPKEANMVRFICWDVVDKTQTIPYDKRLQYLMENVFSARQMGVKKIFSAQTTKVECLSDVEKLFEEAILRGEEGVIAKNLKAFWEPKRSFNLCKFKAEYSADLIVIDWESGTGKYDGILGALVGETSDGELQVNVGSGYSDCQRKVITAESSIGKIIEVKYNGVIDKKDGGKKSLYLSRFVKFRPDKNVANTICELKG